MSGRGDNNKAGSAGRGASNQSSQGFGEASQAKSNKSEQKGKASRPQEKSRDQSSQRNQSTDKDENKQ